MNVNIAPINYSAPMANVSCHMWSRAAVQSVVLEKKHNALVCFAGRFDLPTLMGQN